MKFRNPWIDPRILRVRPEDVQAYLARQGWHCIGPATDPSLLRYERVEADTNAPTLFVPVQMAGKGPCLDVMIELVAELARHEDRWAVEVLHDILQPARAGSAAANGPNMTPKTEPVIQGGGGHS